MEQLIFIGILVAFSILDAVAKKKRQQSQGEMSYDPTAGGEAPWEPVGEIPPAYDDDASYDDPDGDGIPGQPLPRYTQPYGGSDPGESRGSEGLIPADVWEEIAALAGGRSVQKPGPAPVPHEPPAPVDARRPEVIPARADHAVHAAHARYGQPMAGRLTALDTPEDHAEHGESEEVKRAKLLLAGGSASLREAVILQELLGPPVSLRDDR